MGNQGNAPVAAPRGSVDEAERRRRVRRSAIVFAVIAAAFYVGFIAMMLARGTK
jgi:hypothetical protein